MGNKLYVGNLPYSTTDASLESLFAQAGTVESAKVIVDRDTGRSKGFGFVEMSTDEEASDAISKFNGMDVDGRTIKVSEAKPPVSNGGSGGRGGGNFSRNSEGGGRGGRGGGGGGGFNRNRF